MDTERPTSDRVVEMSDGIENKFAAALGCLDQAPDSILLVGRDGRILYANEESCRSLQYTREELLELRLYDLSDEDSEDRWSEAWMSIGKRRRLRRSGSRRRKDGSEFKVDEQLTLNDSDGSVFVAVFARDKSEQTRVEEALRASESHARVLFDYSPIVIWEEDFSAVKQDLDQLKRNGIHDLRRYLDDHPSEIRRLAELVKVVDVNQKSVEFYGADSKTRLSTELPFYFVDESWDVFGEELVTLAEGHDSFEGEIPVKSPSGDLKNLLVSVSMPPESRQDWGRVLVSFVDITQRVRAEQAGRDYSDRLAALHEIDKAILAAQSTGEIAQTAVDHLSRLVPCYQTSIVGYEPREKRFAVIATNGRDTQWLGRESGFSIEAVAEVPFLSPGLNGAVCSVSDVQKEDLSSALGQVLKSVGLGAMVAIPLFFGRDLVGALSFASLEPDAFSEQQIEIAKEVAASIAVALRQAKLNDEIRDAGRRYKKLYRKLVQTQEAERRHIARELHDHVGQLMTSVKLSLQDVRESSDNREMSAVLDQHIESVGEALDQVRSLSLELRPSVLDDLGLEPAVRWLVDRFARQAGVESEVSVRQLNHRLPGEIEIVCFRLVQEALTNVARHAHAKNILVQVERLSDEVTILVRDDGVGFDVAEARARTLAGSSMGLLGMEERVRLADGSLHIDSRPGWGTTFQVRIPLGDS